MVPSYLVPTEHKLLVSGEASTCQSLCFVIPLLDRVIRYSVPSMMICAVVDINTALQQLRTGIFLGTHHSPRARETSIPPTMKPQCSVVLSLSLLFLFLMIGASVWNLSRTITALQAEWPPWHSRLYYQRVARANVALRNVHCIWYRHTDLLQDGDLPVVMFSLQC